VCERIGLVFATFLELGSVGKVIRSFRGRRLALPRLDRFGEVVWRTPTEGMIDSGLLVQHPTTRVLPPRAPPVSRSGRCGGIGPARVRMSPCDEPKWS